MEEHYIMIVLLVIISFIFSAWSSYTIFKDMYSENPKFNFSSEHTDLVSAAISVCLYIFISSLGLTLCFLLYQEKFFEQFLYDLHHKTDILDSGLFSTFILIIAGCIIRLIYYICYKIDSKFHKKNGKKYIDNLSKEERTWIMLISLFFLVAAGIDMKDYNIVCSALVLILGKIFWVDGNFEELVQSLKEFLKLHIFIILLLGLLAIISLCLIFLEDYILLCVFFLILGFVGGIVLYAYRNKGNN